MSDKDKFREDARFRVLSLLRADPELTQRDIASELGLSLGAVNYCLKGLIEKGHIKLGNVKNSKDKIKYLYLLTPEGIAEKAALTSRFLKRRMQEYEALKTEIESLTEEMEFQSDNDK